MFFITVCVLQEETVDEFLGHQFVPRRMLKPNTCLACEEIIWHDCIACLSECLYVIIYWGKFILWGEIMYVM